MKKIRVYSPGTVANLVCGFDILGLALSAPNDIMELSLTEEPAVTIRNLDSFNLPTDPEKNVAGVVLLSIIEKTGRRFGFDISIEKHIKTGSGNSYSADMSTAPSVASNQLL